MALPAFYINSSSLGLDLTWLLMDYVSEVGPGDSCFGGGGTREVQVLFSNYDGITREETKERGLKIIKKAQQRLVHLPANSEEAKQLHLLIRYVQTIRSLTIERSESNLAGSAASLTKRLSDCTRKDDEAFFKIAISDIQDEINLIRTSKV